MHTLLFLDVSICDLTVICLIVETFGYNLLEYTSDWIDVVGGALFPMEALERVSITSRWP